MFIESRVIKTKFSDKVIWSYLINEGVNIANFTSKQFRNILAIFPKIILQTNNREGDKIFFSTIGFLHVIIEKQLNYQFFKKFNIAYRPIDVSLGSSSVFEKENSRVATNELVKTIQSFAIKKEIDDLKKDILNTYSNAEFLEFYKFIDKAVPETTKVIISIFSKNYINSLNSLSIKDQYLYIFLLSKKLKLEGFDESADLLLCKNMSTKEKKNYSSSLRNVKLASYEYDYSEISHSFKFYCVPDIDKLFNEKIYFIFDTISKKKLAKIINKDKLITELLIFIRKCNE
jgi:hypothetical protein